MNTELPVTNRQFLIILLTNAESSVDCCRYNLDLLKLSRWYAQAEDWDYEKIREMYAEPIQSYLQTHTEEELKRGLQDIFYFNNPYTCGKRQVTAACDSSPGIASLELRLI